MAETSKTKKTLTKEEQVEKLIRKLKAGIATLPKLKELGEDDYARDEMLAGGFEPGFIHESMVTRDEDFGNFRIVKTSSHICFRTYTGFQVSTSRFSINPFDGKASETCLYAHLSRLIDMKDNLEKNGDKPLMDDERYTYRDMYEAMLTITEQNLIQPISVFSDYDRAAKAANEFMDYMIKSTEDLKAQLSERIGALDDGSADAEEMYRANIEELLIPEQDG